MEYPIVISYHSESYHHIYIHSPPEKEFVLKFQENNYILRGIITIRVLKVISM